MTMRRVLRAVGGSLVLTLIFASGSVRAELRGRGEERASRRAGWAALLVTAVGASALLTGGAYLWRDNPVGRGLAVTGGGWGGASLGAGTAYGLSLLTSCHQSTCEDDRAAPVFVGALLGGVAGSLLATWTTSTPGTSRPITAAAGMAPFIAFSSFGLIFDW